MAAGQRQAVERRLRHVLGRRPVPTANGQSPGVTNLSGGWSLAIPAKSSNQSAWPCQFIQTANSPALLANFDAVSGQLPVEGNVAKNSVVHQRDQLRPAVPGGGELRERHHYRPRSALQPDLSADIAARSPARFHSAS